LFFLLNLGSFFCYLIYLCLYTFVFLLQLILFHSQCLILHLNIVPLFLQLDILLFEVRYLPLNALLLCLQLFHLRLDVHIFLFVDSEVVAHKLLGVITLDVLHFFVLELLLDEGYQFVDHFLVLLDLASLLGDQLVSRFLLLLEV